MSQGKEVYSLFKAVFDGFMNSLSPLFNQIFNSYIDPKKKRKHVKYSDEELDAMLEDLLTIFPRTQKVYQKIIDTLLTFVETNFTVVLNSLCSEFKKELIREQNQPSSFIALDYFPLYDMSNIHHYNFLHYLLLIILSDLIYAIFNKFPNRITSKLVLCGFNLCKLKNPLPKLLDLLVDTWSLIFYRISSSLSEISSGFEENMDPDCSAYIFHLISRVQSNTEFMEAVLSVIQQAKKTKTLNSEMLSHLSVLISRSRCDENILNEFFKIAWEIRNDATLKYGAIEIVTVLFSRLLSQSKKQSQFYQTRVYKHANNNSKLARSAHAFLRLIRGNISTVPDVGEGVNPLDYISSPPIISCGESYLSVFMRVYFPKSNFSMAYDFFTDILVHLASLDINEFEKAILPKFLAVNVRDPRYKTLLMALPMINSKLFEQNSLCKAERSQIESINTIVRQNILDRCISILIEETEKKPYVFVQYSYQLQNLLNKSNNSVTNFVLNNGYKFTQSKVQLNTEMILGDAQSLVLQILKCMTICFIKEDFKREDLLRIIVMLTINQNQVISVESIYIFKFILDKYNDLINPMMVTILKMFRESFIPELCTRVLQIFSTTVERTSFSSMDDIKNTMIVALLSDTSICRSYAMQILLQIGQSVIFSIFNQWSNRFSQKVDMAILAQKILPKPSIAEPTKGHLEYKYVCSSDYFDIWIIFYAEIMKLLISDKKCMKTLLQITKPLIDEIPKALETHSISDERMVSIFFIYLSALTVTEDFGIQDIPIEEMVTLLHQSSQTYYFEEEEEEEKEEQPEQSEQHEQHAIQGNEEEEEEEQFLEFPIIEHAKDLATQIVECNNYRMQRAFIYSLRYLDWRVLPSILPIIISINPELYSELSSTISLIIQNDDNFLHIIELIFDSVLNFLNLLQSYFSKNNMNSAKTIDYDYQNIKKYYDLCLNYCIIISATFNNISINMLRAQEFDISTRQILFTFLYHWTQLPEEFDQLKAYSLNALIPIIHTGTIFIDESLFDMTIFDMMIQCQFAGFPVLNSLLRFQFDFFINKFITQCFLKPKRESNMFIEVILSVLKDKEFISHELLLPRAGALILLTDLCGQDKIPLAQEILTIIATHFLSSNAKSTIDIIQDAQHLHTNVPSLFQFATEQLIQAAFEIIINSNKVIVVKDMVRFLKPWFSKLRLLPNNLNIMQRIPTKFKVYTVLTFLNEMFRVTESLNEEQLDIFGQLWYELLHSADNNVVVFLCLWEQKDQTLKQKIFTQMLDRNPALITQYLVGRCTFSYWYFTQTQPKYNESSSFEWLEHLLTNAFITNYDGITIYSYAMSIHYSLLFIEKAHALYETLMLLFGIETSDTFFWTPENSDGTMIATSVINQIADKLVAIDDKVIDNWAQEAARWVVGCNEIKLSYRSLVILNCLSTRLKDNKFDPNFDSLLFEAVSYHLSEAKIDDCEYLVRFVGESFNSLYLHLDSTNLPNLAFRYASAFIKCPPFETNCLEKAMPIFKKCINADVLSEQVAPTIIKAFYPFAARLESNIKAQETLRDIFNLKLANADELYLVAAPFLIKPLPFIEINKTYEEIMSMKFTLAQVHKALWFYKAMLTTATTKLGDYIFTITKKLLNEFKKINIPELVPIYQAAIERVARSEAALSFLRDVNDICPQIASPDTLQYSAQIRNLKTLDDVRNEIQNLIISSNDNTVAFTDCKNLQHLHGMITMKNPPRINPFSNGYELYLSMKEKQEKMELPKPNQSKWSSSVSINSQIMSNPSLANITTSTMQNEEFEKMKYEKLKPGKVIQKKLDLPIDDNETNKNIWKFVIPLNQFYELGKTE